MLPKGSRPAAAKWGGPLTKLIIEPDAHDAVRDHAVNRSATRRGSVTTRDAWNAVAEAARQRREGRVDRAQIDVEIFELEAPVADDQSLDAGANGPTQPGA